MPIDPEKHLVDLPDGEIDALAICLRVLLPLEREACGRVVEYLDDRLLKSRALDDRAPPPAAPRVGADRLLERVRFEALNAERSPVDGCRCLPKALLDDIAAHLGPDEVAT